VSNDLIGGEGSRASHHWCNLYNNHHHKNIRQERILAHRRKSKLVIYSLSYDETRLAKEAWVAGVF